MGISKNRGTPKSSILINRIFHYKPSIFSPYFWKQPFLSYPKETWHQPKPHMSQLQNDRFWGSKCMAQVPRRVFFLVATGRGKCQPLCCSCAI